jgi:CheY-like chemotaxis protein
MRQIATPSRPIALVVDDDALLRFNAVDILEELGFLTEEADCAEAAIDMLEAGSAIQLVVTDIQMPGAFDGLELARRVRERWPHVGVVVTSGLARPSHTDLPVGGHFLAKPYPARELITHVNNLLQTA